MDVMEKRKIFTIGLLLFILLASTMVSLTVGAYNISVLEVYNTLTAKANTLHDVDKLHNTIIWNIRLPRIILALTVGVALASAGAAFQGCFRNPLVEPYILGVSSGGAFGAALAIVYPGIGVPLKVSAFVFGGLAVTLAYLLSRVQGETAAATLVITGVVIGSIFTALVSILKYLAGDTALREIVFWLMGGFYYAKWNDVKIITPIVFSCFLILWFMSWRLNVLSMGDDEARTLGVNPERIKLVVISLATLISALSVSAVGIIAWVGLMMPHAARMILGPDHRFMLPATALLGAIYLLLCDTLARTLTTAEIPVGIITSILGAPYLLYLIRSKGRHLFG